MSNIPDKFRYSLTMLKDEHHQGNTTKQKPSKRLVCLGVILCIILGFGIAWKIYYTKINQNVLSYEEDIWCYARMYEMEDYVTLVEAVMMQESRGKGIDVMQSSECMYNTLYDQRPNGIKDTQYSIEVGIRYLRYCLTLAGAQGPEDMDAIKLALQGYNYGAGYIDWALERDGEYTKENAEVFSEMMKESKQIEVYGDTNYVSHVLRYYRLK